MRVLIVEDNTSVAMTLTAILESAGHEVMGPASTLAEALALCAVLPPELGLLDIKLRNGSNGVNVARVLFQRWGVLSIFASGQVVEARRARDFALGFIRKPYEAKTVLRSVEVAREVMNGGQPRSVPAGFELFSAASVLPACSPPAPERMPAPGPERALSELTELTARLEVAGRPTFEPIRESQGPA